MSTTSDRLRFGVCFGFVLAAATAVADPPLDPPREYLARGRGHVTVSGPACCGDTRFSGRFEAAYQIDSAGRVALTQLGLVLDDTDVTVHDTFLGLFTETVRLRCAALGTRHAAFGSQSGNELHFPAGTVTLGGFSAESRLPDGACAPASLRLREATNDALVRFVHEPGADRVGFDGTFTSTAGGDTYAVVFHATGTFDNRPPLASLQFDTPAAPQGLGCPAVYQPNVGWFAEANAPSGHVAALHSSTGDPDRMTGGSNNPDVLDESWFRSRDGGPRALVGRGYRTAPQTFEWGPLHRVELLSTDLAGARSAAACEFRVRDTLPPVVTPPPPRTVSCSVAGGATRNTSAGVKAFLEGATAADAADPALTQLPSQVAGIDVTGTTLFPLGTRVVTFRFLDDSGRLGTAQSSLTVVNQAPSVAVAASPAFLPPNFAMHTIHAAVTASDDCGPVTLLLQSIVSNAPAYDAADISGAAYGTDDRTFSVRARLPPGLLARVYRVTYRGTDAYGLTRLAFADVKVK
ncbi:MAG: hypothetical protein ABW221_19780 [Vicinamibacteria bacterium]